MMASSCRVVENGYAHRFTLSFESTADIEASLPDTRSDEIVEDETEFVAIR